MSGPDLIQDPFESITALSVPVFVAATVLLWLGDRPGGPLRWRLASLSALAAAGLGLLVNQGIAQLWFRERPFAAHPGDAILLVPPSQDDSFPSDHATAAFAIAFAVFFFSRRAGAVFLTGAFLVGVSRIFVGLHYPGDVAAGAVIGLASAAVVVFLARRPVEAVAALTGRLTDPIVEPLWLRLTRALAAGRERLARRPGGGSP